jgi:hypothetical protein
MRGSILQDERLPEAQTAADEALKHYNGMLKGVDTLIARRRAALEATQDALAAARDVALARIALEQTLGAPLPDGPEVLSATPAAMMSAAPAAHHDHATHAGH